MTGDEKLTAFLHETSNRNFQDIRWELKQLKAYRDGLFTYAPYRIGDWVALKITVAEEYPDSWAGRNGFMVRGALAQVQGIDWIEGKFYVRVKFDNEWYDRYDYKTKETKRVPAGTKAPYSMPASWFRPAMKPEPQAQAQAANAVNERGVGQAIGWHECPVCKTGHVR